jgi:hypothetical protein
MLNLPLILFALLLFGMALSYLVAARWPRAIYHTAFAVVGIGLVVWLPLGQQLPQSAQLGGWTQELFFPTWQWQVDETIWLLSGVLLLLVFSLLLFRAGRLTVPPDRFNHFSRQLKRSEWQPILLLALVMAGLSAIWASTLATLMMSWTLLAIFWALYLLTTGDVAKDLSSVTHRLFWMLAPLLFAGIAAAAKPVGSDLLDMGSWSQAAVVAVFITIMAQMGIMPFVGWRPRTDRWRPTDGPVLYLIPPLVGSALLARLVATAHIESGEILLLTVFALISILSGVRRAWTNLRSTARLPAELALSLSGLAFLAAIWAGPEALLAGVQLLVFALTILFLLENLPISRVRWWRAIAPAMALLTLAGFPLTAGFITLASVYTIWLTNALFVLLLALVLLLIPLITAVLIFVRDHINTKPAANQQNRSVITEVAQLIPAAGLLMLGGIPWSEIHIAAWLVLLATTAGALLLIRYVGEVQEAISTVDAALSPDKLPFTHSGPTAQKFARQLMFSLSEAAFILEEDRGLLWLTAFLAILLFAISS